MNIKEETTGGIKHDQEKPRMDLLSSSWIEGVSNVLAFGAKKYADNNWRKGIARGRLLGACLRHVFAYLSGEDYDKETGLLHLYHASCCLMFASELHFTRPDLDDRYKSEDSKESDLAELEKKYSQILPHWGSSAQKKEDEKAYGSKEHKERYGSSSGSGETEKEANITTSDNGGDDCDDGSNSKLPDNELDTRLMRVNLFDVVIDAVELENILRDELPTNWFDKISERIREKDKN